MADNKIIGYKKMFGLVLPDWVDEKTIRLVAYALISVAVMFLVLIFLVWPNMEVVRTKTILLKSEEEALTLLQNSKNDITRVQNELTPKEQDLILSAIPQQYSPETAIYMLRSISNESGVAITSYSLPSGTLFDSLPGAGTNRNNSDAVEFGTFPIRLTVAAPIEALLGFVTKIESSLPFGVVSDLNLQEVTKLAQSTSSKSVQLSLEIVFYQSNLKAVNLNRVQPFSEADLVLARDLSRYNIFTTQETGSVSDISEVGTNNVFGF